MVRLSAREWAGSPFGVFQKDYPLETELRVSRWEGDPDGIRRAAMTGNVLHIAGAGPRIYDAMLVGSGAHRYQAYVVQQGDGTDHPINSLLKQGVIRRVEGGAGGSGFENFMLADYGPYLREVAIKAAEATHFGNLDKSGQRFLYQTIPGMNLPGKRRISQRAARFQGLMEKVGVSVQDKLVLDLGCNLGLLMSQYLKLGAFWCHGWDFPTVVAHTETMLGALGCTRFSSSGAQIDRALPVRENLPEFLRPKLDGCVISYVAIRRHIGWLDALGEIPWSFMIYEGHKYDTEADFSRHIQEISDLAGCTAATTAWDCEKGSRPRPMAIFVRR